MAKGETKRPAREREEAPAPGPDLDLFPEVPAEARPRDIVFDTLRESDRQALIARGYHPVILRLMPRRTPAEEHRYFTAFMQGALEQTIAFDKARSDALFYELKSRGHLDKRHFDAPPKEEAQTRSITAALSWTGSRHTFADNTTIVEPEKMMELFAKLREVELQEQHAPKGAPGRKKKGPPK